MGLRRLAREISLRMLFQFESGERLSPDETFALFCQSFNPQGDEENVLECEPKRFDKALPYIRDLFFGVTGNLAEIDRIIVTASENWRLDRMSRVDRNVMRMAVYEMNFRSDIPMKVSINEAIDLGKAFGTEESGSFINGILDKVHQHLRLASSEEKVE